MIGIINTPDSVLAYFKQEDYTELISKGVNKRQLERDGIKRLLNELGYDSYEIAYKQTGQPYFEGQPHIFLSVSHAKGWFAVIIGTKPVGVDIQTHSSRLIEGQDYFRNEKELPFSQDEQALHLIWGAKEAFYKLKEGQIPDLKEDVSIVGIEVDEVLMDYQDTTYALKFQLIEDVYLVFTT